MSRNPTGFNIKSGAEHACELCGVVRYFSPCQIREGKKYFCCRAHSQEHKRTSRRKMSHCVVCSKEMTGYDLKQFWGKCGRDENGNPHGMCRVCKASKDETNRLDGAKRIEQERASARARTLEKKKKMGLPCRCMMCENEGKVDSLTHWCKECATKSSVVHRKLRHKIMHAMVMNDPKKHLNMTMRVSVRQCLAGEKKNRSTFDLVGYSVNQLKAHLERQFEPSMSWNNYGKEWHIDHIIPLSAFNFRVPEDPDFKRAWALSNLRPLWAKENLSKNDKLSAPFQPCLSAA